MAWSGVIIRDGLKDTSVLDNVGILRERTKELGISGMWEVLDVSVSDDGINKVIKLLEKGLRPAWYATFKQKGRVIIVFKGKSFNIKKSSKRSLTEVKNWAFKKYNILPETFSLQI